MGQRDHSATSTDAGRDAQALVEQRIQELRALAAEQPATSRAGGITTSRGDAVADEPVPGQPVGVREVDIDPIPAVTFEARPKARTRSTASTTLRPIVEDGSSIVDVTAAAAAASPAQLDADGSPVTDLRVVRSRRAPEAPATQPPTAAHAGVAPTTTSGAQAAAIASTIEHAIDRVEHALQRDTAEIASTLQSWGSPARAAGDLGDQLGMALQRMEHALRADIARVAQSAAVAAEGAQAPQQVLEAVAAWSQRVDDSLEERLGGVHAQLLQFDARIRALVEPVSGVASGAQIAADLVPTLTALQGSIVELGNGIGQVRAGVDAHVAELATELTAIDSTIADRLLGDDNTPLDAQLAEAVGHIDAQLTAAVAGLDERIEQVIAAATATAAAGIVDEVRSVGASIDAQVVQLAESLATIDASTGPDGAIVAGFRWQLDELRTSVDARFDQLTDLVASSAAAAAAAPPAIEVETVDEIRASLRQIELRTAPVNDRLHDLSELLGALDARIGTDVTPLSASIARIVATLEDTTRIEGIAASVQHLGEQLDSGLLGLVGEQLDAAVTSLQARIASEGEDARTDVRAMVAELVAVLENAAAADGDTGEAVSTERLTQLLGSALESHHADLAADLRELEETLLATQDDVPEELTLRVTSAIDGLQAQLDQQAGLWTETTTGTRSLITDSIDAMHASIGSDLVAARESLQGDMAELQRRMVSELDYNRLQHVRDVETIIDAMTAGWTAMFQRLQAGDERIARLEQRLETWIDAIDEDAIADAEIAEVEADATST